MIINISSLSGLIPEGLDIYRIISEEKYEIPLGMIYTLVGVSKINLSQRVPRESLREWLRHKKILQPQFNAQ